VTRSAGLPTPTSVADAGQAPLHAVASPPVYLTRAAAALASTHPSTSFSQSAFGATPAASGTRKPQNACAARAPQSPPPASITPRPTTKENTK
jgi:hypothetical protein